MKIPVLSLSVRGYLTYVLKTVPSGHILIQFQQDRLLHQRRVLVEEGGHSMPLIRLLIN